MDTVATPQILMFNMGTAYLTAIFQRYSAENIILAKLKYFFSVPIYSTRLFLTQLL